MEYLYYTDTELHDMFVEPRRIAKNPYRLHAAFMLSCLYDLYDNNGNEPFIPENTWGWNVDKKELKALVKNANNDFINACDNDLTIDIWNHAYSIRHSEEINKDRLKDIFHFTSVSDNDYIVAQTGIMNLNTSKESTPNAEFMQNKSYLQKVVEIAEDDEHDGWNKLTDMETTMYLWHLWCCKKSSRDYEMFRSLYKSELYTNYEDDKKCFNSRILMQLNPLPMTQYLFSAKKVKEWNRQHGQKSIID